MFAILLFNILFLSVSIIERRLGYWIDEFTTILNHILQGNQSGDKKPAMKKTGIKKQGPKKKNRK
jgi:hypothetical protein